MSEPTACLSLVTLGVSDLAKSTAFYEALGFRRKSRGADGVAFFEAGGVILSLWPTAELAKDAEIESANSGGFRGMSLAWNCTSASEVDRALARAMGAGVCSGVVIPLTSPTLTGISGKLRTIRNFRSPPPVACCCPIEGDAIVPAFHARSHPVTQPH